MYTNTSDSHTTYNENYKTLTEKNKQLHKHAKHFGWKFREAHFQAKQVLTQLTWTYKDLQSCHQIKKYAVVYKSAIHRSRLQN